MNFSFLVSIVISTAILGTFLILVRIFYHGYRRTHLQRNYGRYLRSIWVREYVSIENEDLQSTMPRNRGISRINFLVRSNPILQLSIGIALLFWFITFYSVIINEYNIYSYEYLEALNRSLYEDPFANRVGPAQNMFDTILILLNVSGSFSLIAFLLAYNTVDEAEMHLLRAGLSRKWSEKLVLSRDEKLSSIKIEQVIKDYPEAKNVRKVKMSDTMKNLKDAFEDVSNVLVVDNNDKPLGILYKLDIFENDEIKEKLDSNTDRLEDLIEKIEKDFITKGKWSKDKGIKNFALLSLSDNLISAKEKMHAVGGLAVRGVVTEPNGRATAIVTFDLLIAYIK
jgi:hypothetical protein